MPRFHALPRIISIAHKPHVGTYALERAIAHARRIPIDPYDCAVGCSVSYDGNGIPIDWDRDPDAETLEAITLDLEFAR